MIYIYTGHVDDEMWWCIYNDFGFQQTHTYSQHPYGSLSSHKNHWSENPKPLNLARKKGLFRDLRSKIKKSATTSGLSDRDGNQRFEPVVRLFNWLGSGRFNIRHWMMDDDGKYGKSWLILTWFLMSNSDFQGFDFRNMHMTVGQSGVVGFIG